MDISENEYLKATGEFGDTDRYDFAGSIDVDSVDFDVIAEAAIGLLASYLYHHSDQEGKLATLVSTEYLIQKEYLDKHLYKPSIIRQSAFIEYFLTAHLVNQFEEKKGESLTSSEMGFLNRHLGNTGRYRLVSMFGILSESEEQAISELMKARNEIAHNPWVAFSAEAEERYERISTQVHGIFEELQEDQETLEAVSETVMSKIND